MEEKQERIGRLLIDSFHLLCFPRMERFTDLRRRPSIRLQSILLSLTLMPLWGLKSLLALDQQARLASFKRLFGCQRKMLVSDSTCRRVLGWARRQEIGRYLLSLRRPLEALQLLRAPLVAGGKPRRLAVLDGSLMGGHWLTSLCLVGRVHYPALVYRCAGQGREMERSHQLLRAARTCLGPSFPDLVALDGYYFTVPTFRLVRELGAHILLKVRDAEFRTVLADAANLFAHFGGERRAEGFDRERLCSWRLDGCRDCFAGYPVQVMHLREYYPKRAPARRQEECWITTTDLSLSAAEAREAAHQRWRIENGLFKGLSQRAGTKHFYFKDPRPFFNLLRLLMAGQCMAEAITYILRHRPPLFKSLLAGAKATWKAVWQSVWEGLPEAVFVPPGLKRAA